MVRKITRLIYSGLIAAILAACAIFIILFFQKRTYMDMQNAVLPGIDSVSSQQWHSLGRKKIFFAHMSVGYNILDGVKSVLGENNVAPLEIIETSAPIEFQRPGLYHALLGFNAQPFEKLKSFENLLGSAKTAPDIALMKLCYVDITAGADVQRLFDAYRAAIVRLQERLPQTLFLHCTVPLTSEPLNLKEQIKQCIRPFLGRTVRIDDNIARMQFNRMLREVWPSESIYDIAAAESANAAGFLRCKKTTQGLVSFLRKEFTSDGGHLNARGAKQAGTQLLIALAKSLSD